MNTHERRIAATILREHYGETWVGECAESPHIVVYTPFDNGPVVQVFQKSIGKVDVVIDGVHHIRSEDGRELAEMIISNFLPHGWDDD